MTSDHVMGKWYFTLARSQGGPGCVEVEARDYQDARTIMFKVWGDKWAFQYDSIDEVHPVDRKIILKIRDV